MKLAVIITIIMLLPLVCLAGEKEELMLRKANIELMLQNYHLQVQIIQGQFKEAQEALKGINSKLEPILAAEKAATEKKAEKKEPKK